jgi:hypothetical protein
MHNFAVRRKMKINYTYNKKTVSYPLAGFEKQILTAPHVCP